MKDYPQLPKRKKRKAAQCFMHPVNLRGTAEFVQLRNQYGSDGYSVGCYLMEVIAESDNLTFGLNPTVTNGIAIDLGIHKLRVRDIIDRCIAIGLVQGYMDSGKFYLRSLFLEDKLLLGTNKVKDRDAIVEKDKAGGFFMAQPRDLDMVVTYFTERGYPNPEKNAEKFYNYYEANGWKYGNPPKPIIKWRAKAAQWNMDGQLEGDKSFSFGLVDSPAVETAEKTPFG